MDSLVLTVGGLFTLDRPDHTHSHVVLERDSKGNLFHLSRPEPGKPSTAKTFSVFPTDINVFMKYFTIESHSVGFWLFFSLTSMKFFARYTLDRINEF